MKFTILDNFQTIISVFHKSVFIPSITIFFLSKNQLASRIYRAHRQIGRTNIVA